MVGLRAGGITRFRPGSTTIVKQEINHGEKEQGINQ